MRIATFVILCRAIFCIVTEVSETPLDAIFIFFFTEDGGSSFLEYILNLSYRNLSALSAETLITFSRNLLHPEN